MSKQNTSSKGFAPWRWLKRMFFGASKEYTLADERYDSPGKLAVKRFFRNPLAVIALVILVGMFLFVFIGPIFAPVDLTETGSEMLHVNVRPTMSLMKLPDDMKDGAVDISSRGTFTIGVLCHIRICFQKICLIYMSIIKTPVYNRIIIGTVNQGPQAEPPEHPGRGEECQDRPRGSRY